MNELIEQVRQWGRDRNITGPNAKATLLSQLAKTQEELTETRDAAVLLNYLQETHHYNGSAHEAIAEDLKDGIGDTIVTLILAADLAGLTIQECLQAAYDEIKNRTGSMVNGQFVKDK